jgi:hypothetical protein
VSAPRGAVELLVRAHELAKQGAPHPTRDALLSPLGWLAAQAASGPVPDASVEWALRQAMPVALRLAIDAPPADEILDLLAAARDVQLDHADRGRALPVPVRAASPRAHVATRGRPALLPWSAAATVATREPAGGAPPPAAATDERAIDPSHHQPSEDQPAPRAGRISRQPEPADLPGVAPPVSLADDTPDAVSDARWIEGVVHTAIDRAAAAVRARGQRTWSAAAEADEILFAQIDAVAAAGRPALEALLAFWDQSLESPHPFGAAAVATALASLEGPEALSALLPKMEALPRDDTARGRAISEALASSPHPELGAFARMLAASPHPIARAAGVETLAALRAISPEELGLFLTEASPPVLAAAARSVLRSDPKETVTLLPVLRKWLGLPYPDVVWEAARSLLVLGHRDPLDEARQGRLQLHRLGARGPLLLAMAGTAVDAPLLAKLVERTVMTPAHLGSLSRFGHAGMWAFFVHALEQPDLSDAASDALVNVFGELVEPTESEDPGAWRAALKARPFDVATRWRGGEPWSAAALVADARAGTAPRHRVQHDVDELAVRLRLAKVAHLDGLVASAQAGLDAFLGDAERSVGRTATGAWVSPWP